MEIETTFNNVSYYQVRYNSGDKIIPINLQFNTIKKAKTWIKKIRQKNKKKNIEMIFSIVRIEVTTAVTIIADNL